MNRPAAIAIQQIVAAMCPAKNPPPGPPISTPAVTVNVVTAYAIVAAEPAHITRTASSSTPSRAHDQTIATAHAIRSRLDTSVETAAAVLSSVARTSALGGA